MSNIGILDPTGQNNNPFNNKPYSDKYKEISKAWSKLPVYGQAADILKEISNNQVVLIISSTGSGKSVIIPKLALHTLNYTGNVAMTLPKQILAKSAASYAALTMDVELGSYIGYQYKGSPKDSKSSDTRLLYATDGTITARVSKDPYLRDFDCIVIDEAHELTNGIILLLFLLRETLKLRPEFKIIIMSATVNQDIFVNYYKDFKFKSIDVGGERLFPIASHFLNKSLDYNAALDEGFNTLIKILETDDPTTEGAHDIVFFITSSNEAFTLCRKLHKYIEEQKNNCKITCHGDVYCVELYANMPADKQELAQDRELYKKDTKYNRKVAIATNVAESSLTINGVKYVIDVGFELKSSYDPELHARRLDRGLITQAQAKQRMGRAGRTEAGICYHMYTESDFNTTMKKFPEPSLVTDDITGECIRLLNIENVQSFEKLLNILTQLIVSPKEEYIKSSLSSLIRLGIAEKSVITNFGRLVNDIPLDSLELAISSIYGKLYNCSNEILKIAAMIEVCKGNINDLYYMPTILMENKTEDKNYKIMLEKFQSTKKKFSHKDGDHLSLLNIFDDFEKQYKQHHNNHQKLNEWAFNKFLKVNSLIKAVKQFKKNRQRFYTIESKQFNFEHLDIKENKEISNSPVNNRILCCLILGHQLNTATKTKSGYKTQFASDNIKISRNSFILLKDKEPKNVFYHELFISMGKSDLVLVSNIPSSIMKILSS